LVSISPPKEDKFAEGGWNEKGIPLESVTVPAAVMPGPSKDCTVSCSGAK